MAQQPHIQVTGPGAPTGREEECLQCRQVLRRQNTLLHEMLERITDGFVSLDAEWRILYANPQAEKMVPVRREDYEGRNFWTIFPELAGTVFQEQYERAVREKVAVHFETYFAPLGQWYEVSAYPDPSGLSVLFRDVTEKRRLAEELHKLSLIATNSQVMVVFTDAARRITWVNEAFTRCTGYALADVLGLNPGELLQGPESDRAAVDYMRGQISRDEPFHTEVINYTRRGEKYWADVYGQPVIGADGRVQQYFAVSINVTERRRLQEQLLREQKQRQQVVTAATIRAQEDERARVGRELHDNVNQVLTTVKLYLELCCDGLGNGELMRKSVELIQGSIDEIRSLSRRLSSPTRGGLTLADSVRELLHSVGETNRISFALQLEDVEGLEVEQDLNLAVYRILQEQLTNILKHAGARHVQVCLGLKKRDLVLCVADDGQGFDTARKSRGVGFAHIQARTESLGGTLTLDSAPGKGCRLEVRFPLVSRQGPGNLAARSK